MAEVTREPLEDQQLPVRNRFMSVDPYVRGRMDDWKLCVLPLEIGQVLDGGSDGITIRRKCWQDGGPIGFVGSPSSRPKSGDAF
jgi:NADPH-dependent curcumin reductase CurA